MNLLEPQRLLLSQVSLDKKTLIKDKMFRKIPDKGIMQNRNIQSPLGQTWGRVQNIKGKYTMKQINP
jgi:hypothetical protein